MMEHLFYALVNWRWTRPYRYHTSLPIGRVQLLRGTDVAQIEITDGHPHLRVTGDADYPAVPDKDDYGGLIYRAPRALAPSCAAPLVHVVLPFLSATRLGAARFCGRITRCRTSRTCRIE